MNGFHQAIAEPPALIVVGGHSRGVGKTSTIEHILRARRGERWTAVKISAHRHAHADGAAPLVEEARLASPLTQTGRYLAAGASRALLCRTPDGRMEEIATLLRRLLADGARVIVESNRIAATLSPDALLFLVSPSIDDWKPSSGPCLARADALVTSGHGAAAAAAATAHGAGLDGRPVFEMDSDRHVPGLDAWLDARLAGALGSGQSRRQHVGHHPRSSDGLHYE